MDDQKSWLIRIGPFLNSDGSLNKNKLTKSAEGKKLREELLILNPTQSVPQTIWDLRFGPKLCECCGINKTRFKDGKYLRYCSNKCSSMHNGSGAKLKAYIKTAEFWKRRSDTLIGKFGTDSMISINNAKSVSNGNFHPLQVRANRELALAARKLNFRNQELPKILNVLKQARGIIPYRWGPDEYKTVHDQYRWQHSCGCIFERGLTKLSCPRCATLITAPHRKILDLISELRPDLTVASNDRSAINPLELDVYLPDLQLGIEINGVFWHTERMGRGGTYHLRKTELAKAQGIKLLQIMEDEIDQKFPIVKSRLTATLGRAKRIYARSCQVVNLSAPEANKFLERTHLQGGSNGKIRLGLVLKNQIVAVMTLGTPRFTKKYDWELLRYTTELEHTVVGGAGKLLAEFRRRYLGSIVSYADRRWSDGNLYRSLGFTELSPSAPSYVYLNTKTMQKLSRFSAQKHKLSRLLGAQFDENLSEVENMTAVGFDRIFDCGSLVFELR